MLMDAPKKVFLNHAHEDAEVTRQLYEELIARGIDVWFDKESLLPGQTWQLEITKAIRACSHFILVFSSNSVNKTGHVNVEIYEALKQVTRRPPGEVYIIPIRLDECEVNFLELQNIQWVDLFPEDKWYVGLERIFKVLDV